MVLETLAVKLVLDAAEFASGMGQAESKFAKLGKSLSDTGRSMTLGVTLPLVGIAAAALKTAGDFEQTMNVMQQVAGATTEQMAGLQAQALQLGKDTSFSAGEAAGAMLELAKAGLSVEEVSGAIPGVLDLAAAGGLALASSAEIAANAMNAFGLQAEDTTRIANMFAAAANASSVDVKDISDAFKMASAVWSSNKQSIDSLTASISLLGNAGIKGSDAGTSLKQMMLSLVAPTKTASEVMAQYSISAFDSQGNIRDFADILANLEDALGANAKALVTVGGPTKEMIEDIKGADSKIASLNGKLSEQAMELQILQNELVGIAEKYGDGSTQADRKRLAIEKLTNKMDDERSQVGELQASLDAYNSAIANSKTTEEALADAMRAKALATIFGSDAVRAATILINEGVDGYNKMIASVNEAGAAQAVAEARMKGLSGALLYFKGTLDTVMISTATPWLDQLSQMIRGAADLIAKFSELPASVQRNVVIFGALLAAAGPVLIILGSLISAVTTIAGAITALGPVMAGAAAAIAALGGPITIAIAAIAALALAWSQNWFDIRGKAEWAWEGIKSFVSSGIDFIKGAFSIDWGQLGRGLIDGIVNGIRAGWNAVTEAASNIATGALDAAKRALGIASPSREGLAIGVNFGESIGAGANRALRGISTDVAGQLNAMTGGLRGQVSMAGAGGVSIVLNQTFSGNVDRSAVAAGSRAGTLAALREVGLA